MTALDLPRLLHDSGLTPAIEQGEHVASCGATLLHLRTETAASGEYLHARCLIVGVGAARGDSDDTLVTMLAALNAGVPAGALVFDPRSRMVVLGLRLPAAPPFADALPPLLWALATAGERLAPALQAATGGFTTAQVRQEAGHGGSAGLAPIGAPPVTFAGPWAGIEEARARLDDLVPTFWAPELVQRGGPGQVALLGTSFIMEVGAGEQPYPHLRVQTRVVGPLGDYVAAAQAGSAHPGQTLDLTPALAWDLNRWNAGLGGMALGYAAPYRQVMCSSLLPAVFLRADLLGWLVTLHGSMAEQQGMRLLGAPGGLFADVNDAGT